MTASKRTLTRNKTAALYAMLLRDQWFTQWAQSDGHEKRYLAFLRQQATYTPSSQGYCYFLALQAITNVRP